MTRTRSPLAFLVPLSLFIFFSLLFSTCLHRSSSHSEPCSNVRNWKKNDVFCFFVSSLPRLFGTVFFFVLYPSALWEFGDSVPQTVSLFPFSPSSVFPFPLLPVSPSHIVYLYFIPPPVSPSVPIFLSLPFSLQFYFYLGLFISWHIPHYYIPFLLFTIVFLGKFLFPSSL